MNTVIKVATIALLAGLLAGCGSLNCEAWEECARVVAQEVEQ